MLESSLQHNLLRYVYYKKHKDAAPIDITTTSLLQEFPIERLEVRRRHAQIKFLHGLICGEIDDFSLLPCRKMEVSIYILRIICPRSQIEKLDLEMDQPNSGFKNLNLK